MPSLSIVTELQEQLWQAREDQSEPSVDEFEEVENGHLEVKPYGGFWSSTYTPDAEFPSDWVRWCVQESFYGGRDVYRLMPTDNLRVLEVDGVDDLQAIVDQYPEQEKYAKPLYSKAIDFEAIADDGYDAIHLTERGQWKTRLTDADEPDLYGWDSECTLWLQFKFDNIEYMGELTDEGAIERE